MTIILIVVIAVLIYKNKGGNFMKIKGLSWVKKLTRKSIKKNAERIIGIHKNELNQYNFHDGVSNVVEEDSKFRVIIYCTFFSENEECIKSYMDGMVHKMCPEGHKNDICNREIKVYTGITTVYYEMNILK